ncbi:MAG: ABC transporter ATP-binding protein [Chloroflexota bacterium]
MSVVSVQHLTYLSGRRKILDDISFEVEPGRPLAVVGPNGAGKSTLLRLLATAARPAAGSIAIDGIDVARNAPRARRRLGYVPDVFGIYPNLTVMQYLDFFARAAGVANWERRDAVEAMLRVVDMYDSRNELASSLSRGRTRRLALARSLVHNPAVLLLDDPLLGLDGRGRLELREVLRELSQMQITAVVASHLLGDLADICVDVLVLNVGQVSYSGPMSEVLATANRPQQRVRLKVLEQFDLAVTTLESVPTVREVTAANHEVSFLFIGDDLALAELLQRLMTSGVRVVRFGHGGDVMDELSAGLAEMRSEHTA